MSSSISGSRSSSITHQQSYPYYQDAIRIFVQQVGGEEISTTNACGGDPMTTSTSSNPGGNCSRRFSVDPQLTNFDILRNLIGRAFEIRGDFAISYRAFDDLGGETYLPLVSDWDLSAAFLSASEPDLQLIIEPKNIPLNEAELDDEPWDVVQSTELLRDASQNIHNLRSNQQLPGSEVNLGFRAMHNNRQFLNNHQQQTFYQSQQHGRNMDYPSSSSGSSSSSKVMSAMSQLGGAVNQYPISLNSKINTAGIFNTMEKWVQKAKTFVEDLSVVTTRPPLSDTEFRNYLDPGGVLCRPRELRYACYHGGIEPGLRKVVWKQLLNIYPDGMSGNARMEYIRTKSKEYYELRDTWKGVHDGQASEDINSISNMVRKDVLRTDRHLPFFSGPDDNPNIATLFNILTTYSLNHPSVGYCQGMSDLASPLLVTMDDEAQAYVCFCALMDRVKPNFNCDGLAMSLKFTHLSETLAYYDPDFWNYLKTIGADDLLFCYRWMLLELKREFAFEDALRMTEVCFASLPYKPQDVPLFEVKFSVNSTHPIPIQVPGNLTSSYSRVCALRRSSTSGGGGGPILPTANELRGRRFSRKPKVNPLSLDESSLTSSSISTSLTNSGGSGTGSMTRSHTKPFYSLDETMEVLSASDFLTCSPFEMLNLGETPASHKPKKLIKNLKEFWVMSGGGKPGSEDQSSADPDTSLSSKSSTMSNLEAALSQSAPDTDCNGAVFYDDPQPVVTMDAGADRSMTNSPLITKRHAIAIDGNPIRSRHSSINSSFEKMSPIPQRMTLPSTTIFSTPTSMSASITRNSSSSFNSFSPNPHQEQMNLSNKSESYLQHAEEEVEDNNHSPSRISSSFLPLEPLGGEQDDPEQTSQTSNADSENDSGHCYGDSMEMFENDPHFSRGRHAKAKMPPPENLGGGNPFLMFLCLTLLLQHRDHIMKNGMDYNETAMYFDKLIRKHNVGRVLNHARMLYSEYLKQNVTRA